MTLKNVANDEQQQKDLKFMDLALRLAHESQAVGEVQRGRARLRVPGSRFASRRAATWSPQLGTCNSSPGHRVASLRRRRAEENRHKLGAVCGDSFATGGEGNARATRQDDSTRGGVGL